MTWAEPCGFFFCLLLKRHMLCAFSISGTGQRWRVTISASARGQHPFDDWRELVMSGWGLGREEVGLVVQSRGISRCCLLYLKYCLLREAGLSRGYLCDHTSLHGPPWLLCGPSSPVEQAEATWGELSSSWVQASPEARSVMRSGRGRRKQQQQQCPGCEGLVEDPAHAFPLLRMEGSQVGHLGKGMAGTSACFQRCWTIYPGPGVLSEPNWSRSLNPTNLVNWIFQVLQRFTGCTATANTSSCGQKEQALSSSVPTIGPCCFVHVQLHRAGESGNWLGGKKQVLARLVFSWSVGSAGLVTTKPQAIKIVLTGRSWWREEGEDHPIRQRDSCHFWNVIEPASFISPRKA